MNPEPVIKPGEIITWMGLAFETSDQVLIPRRETELRRWENYGSRP